MTHTIEFWINDHRVETSASEGLLLLDFLRNNRRLVGTKEGCKEGDCGACTVLVGERDGDRVRYEAVTSCLVPLGEMHGKHVVSVEGLNLAQRRLNPVQQALVERGGSQCGFCTPGFVVSMCWYMMRGSGEPSLDGFKRAFSGNLCRCTGYASIFRASEDLVEAFGPQGQWSSIWNAEDRVAALADAGLIPAYFKQMSERLATIAPIEEAQSDRIEESEFFVAGGTDLYVQRGEEIPRTTVKILNRHPEMKGIRVKDGRFYVGALTTFEEFGRDEHVRALIPRIDDYLFLIASLQLRNRATLSGNIINASPIGDMTSLMLALNTDLVFFEGDTERTVPMKQFFLGYKTMDKRPNEIMTELIFPTGTANTRVHFEKISKRKCLDIATVNSSIRIDATDTGLIEDVTITLGGVAAVPLWLEKTAAFLTGKAITTETIAEALEMVQTEISPISDVRGSADYKRLLARQLVLAHFIELYPDRIALEDFVSRAS
jgi:xanthine dehydrogenase small subunit